MRHSHLMLAASLAALATTAFVSAASAQAPAAPAVPAQAPAAAAAPTVLGAKFAIIDGYKYGGMLPVGADKNLDAVRIVIRAATALGQLRDNQYQANPAVGGYYLVLGDTSLAMRIDADGTWNGQKSHVVLDWDYGVPGVRLDVTSADGKSRQIQVAANNLAWDEKVPGVYAGPAKTPVQERLILGYLMPSEVLLAARDGALTDKASKDGAHDALTIPLPKLGPGVNMVATFDTEGHPIRSQIAYMGHIYSGEFEDFLADRMDMAVNFSHHVVLKVDGKETANLQLNWHQVNPYLIFPVPAEVTAAK